MEWKLLSFEDKLRYWKNFRNSIQSLPFNAQLDEVACFFAGMPRGRCYLDLTDPESWPTPWEIIDNFDGCIGVVNLLIYYTLIMVNPAQTTNVQLVLVSDGVSRFLATIVDNQFVFNADLGKVSTLHEMSSVFTVIEVVDVSKLKKIR